MEEEQKKWEDVGIATSYAKMLAKKGYKVENADEITEEVLKTINSKSAREIINGLIKEKRSEIPSFLKGVKGSNKLHETFKELKEKNLEEMHIMELSNEDIKELYKESLPKQLEVRRLRELLKKT